MGLQSFSRALIGEKLCQILSRHTVHEVYDKPLSPNELEFVAAMKYSQTCSMTKIGTRPGRNSPRGKPLSHRHIYILNQALLSYCDMQLQLHSYGKCESEGMFQESTKHYDINISSISYNLYLNKMQVVWCNGHAIGQVFSSNGIFLTLFERPLANCKSKSSRNYETEMIKMVWQNWCTNKLQHPHIRSPKRTNFHTPCRG